MADYIYLLENRLSPAQRSALELVRNIARERGVTIFLVGGAVRDLTSGSPVRDLDVAVQGEALKLKADLEKAGAVVTGEFKAGQALFLRFLSGVRMEIGSTVTTSYPKPGKPVIKPASILDDLRRRDFTANAMALSLNAGSYGLLMDPLNGVADLENRQLRLVSNYGFIEDPVRMIRAARYMARLGWEMEEKTAARYETGKQENYIAVLSEFSRGYEAEEIVHEQDPLRVLKRMEAEGWMKVLAPAWTSAKVNVAELERLRETENQLQIQGIHPQAAAAYFPLLTAKLQPAEVAALKKSFPRQGFVAEIDGLEADAKHLLTQLGAKTAAAPSQAWKLLMAARPEVVLWAAYSTKNAALQAKFKSFFSEWPQARQKIPYTLLQEMRIVPELPGYNDLLEAVMFEIMDGRLSTPEEAKAFLEPHSPPAPPPPVNLRRLRAAAKKQAKPSRSRAKKAASEDNGEDMLETVMPEEDAGEDSEEDAAEDLPVAESKLSPVPAPVKAEPTVAETAPVDAGPSTKKAVKKAVAAPVSSTEAETPVASSPKAESSPQPGSESKSKAFSVKSAPAKKSTPVPIVVKASAPKPVAATDKKSAVAAPSPAKAATKQTVKSAPPVKASVKTAAPRKR